MQKIIFLSLFIFSLVTKAQNLQVHYDFGTDRNHITTTFEMFKPDKLGSTFFFVDMDYSSNNVKGISLAYLEVARVLKTKKMPFGIHAEFNGGFGSYEKEGVNYSYTINNAALLGVDYTLTAKDFSKGISAKILYKYITDKHDASFQITTVWFLNFWKKKMTFKGFTDFWREDFDFNFDGKTDAKYVFLTEPQIWYHITNHFDVGGEIEFSNNFAGKSGFYTRPTFAVKWKF